MTRDGVQVGRTPGPITSWTPHSATPRLTSTVHPTPQAHVKGGCTSMRKSVLLGVMTASLAMVVASAGASASAHQSGANSSHGVKLYAGTSVKAAHPAVHPSKFKAVAQPKGKYLSKT